MVLEPGTRFGSYEAVEQIGSGGMGEVWRARDTELSRDVAIKVLPQAFVDDTDRLARFRREAELLAALNHPNIATIHGLEKVDGQTVIVMELVEGPTLAERIREGPIAADEAMGMALQIVSALEAAHGKGIIHRDLKPANVKVRADDTVKVLDFGISKPIDPTAISGGSPVMTTPAVTQAGVILGTAAYMSPEQARGKLVDQRTDIWAFGCLLFEMLTGQPAFGGEDVMLTLARVLDRDTDLSSMPKALSPAVRHTIELCLEKDPRQRIADVRDVRLALQGRFESKVPESAEALLAAPWRRRATEAAGALVLGLLAGVVVMMIVQSPRSEETHSNPARRFSITLPAERNLTLSTGRLVAIAPDGQSLVYRAEEGGVFKLFRRPFDNFNTTIVPGSEGVEGEFLFFSRDSRSVIFRIGGDVMRAPLLGGRPVPIMQLAPATRGGAWAGDDSIVIARRRPEGLLRVPVSGGESESIAVPDWLLEEGINQFWYPQLLGEDRAMLVTAATGLQTDAGRLVVIDLATKEMSTIMPLATAGYVLPTGHLLFVRGSDLWAVRFDLESLEVVGDARVVLQGIRVEGGGAVQVTVADNGTIAYIPGTVTAARTYQLVWVDRNGSEQSVGTPGSYQSLSLSPDDTRVAVSTFSEGNWDIWVHDLLRGGASRLTTDAGLDQDPIWSPDSTQIVYSVSRSGGGIYRRTANGTTPEEAVLTEQPDSRIWPIAFVPNENAIIINDQPGLRRQVSILSIGDEVSRTPIIEESDHVIRPALSPDGRWIAYESIETGRSEIWIRPFPEVDTDRWPVSTNGGQSPVWSGDSSSLFFQQAGAILEAEIVTGPSFGTSNPQVVLDGPYAIEPSTWDVSGDGERFLVRREITSDLEADGERPRAEINVVLDFAEELDRLLPTN